MARNFAAERKRIRDEYEARITDCRAQMDQSWEAKRVRYMPRTDDPFEDVRLRGERMDALFEEVTARNQRVERLRHERDCKLLKLVCAQHRAEGDCAVFDCPTGPAVGPSAEPVTRAPSHGGARRRLFTPDEALDTSLAESSEESPDTDLHCKGLDVTDRCTTAALGSAEPSSQNTELRSDTSSPRPMLKTTFFSVLQLVTKQCPPAASALPLGVSQQ